MKEIFLSYDHRDKDRARLYAEAIERSGCSVFWDIFIPVGTSYPKHLSRMIEEATHVVVLWSKFSVESNWVLQEALKGRELGKLLPVRIDDIENIPFGLADLETADLAGLQMDDPQVLEFIRKATTKPLRRHNASVEAADNMWQAFQLRRVGNFEEAAFQLEKAYRRFASLLDEDDAESFEMADYDRETTLRVLGSMARREYGGTLVKTLSGVSFLPIVDAILVLPVERVREKMPAGCDIRSDLIGRENVRVGVVVRPGAAVNDDLLISKLLEETDWGGSLNLHCSLLVMNTDASERVSQFSQQAAKRSLRADCIIWKPRDGDQELANRLTSSASKLCDKHHPLLTQ